MTIVKAYDLETGLVETVATCATKEDGQERLKVFIAQDHATSTVYYTDETEK